MLLGSMGLGVGCRVWCVGCRVQACVLGSGSRFRFRSCFRLRFVIGLMAASVVIEQGVYRG